MRQYVLQRFRSYSVKTPGQHNDPTFADRLNSKYAEARQAVGLLRRANEGERRPLLRVLFMAYGRTGKRRHELMLPLLSKAGQEELQGLVRTERDGTGRGPASGVGLEDPPPRNPTAEGVNRGQWAPYAPGLTPQMRALLQSQIRNPPPNLTRPTLRRLQPRIEELNSWRQPMPRSRVKNQTKKWYADLLGKVHPPLPTDEWNRLRGLVTGAVPAGMVHRRKPLAKPGPNALELLVKFGKPNIGAAPGNRDAHRITPRFMRRMWAQVFSQCPLMEWDAERQEWKVTWGQHALYGLGRERKRKHSVERAESRGDDDDPLLGALWLSGGTTDETEQMDDFDQSDFWD
ncbi:hypothetical protein LTR36_004057 [Oleoguttula mirabilis]|uniref:LYR motif-containing protein Cup1-like N-terminal domain-containing protein n=1 Tax=Oleoguttula mirabilis TaxID=1507867 RepID=A0AAV9JI00_9PEZI|nr:hypothetical protein LTR36_004057 [Oleoguttula mirabilis]